MNKDNAIKYLDRKGQLQSEKYNPTEPEPETESEEQLIDKDEALIARVEKEGKIFGDPLVRIEG